VARHGVCWRALIAFSFVRYPAALMRDHDVCPRAASCPPSFVMLIEERHTFSHLLMDLGMAAIEDWQVCVPVRAAHIAARPGRLQRFVISRPDACQTRCLYVRRSPMSSA